MIVDGLDGHVKELKIDLELLKMQQQQTSTYVREFHANFQMQMSSLDIGTLTDYKAAFNGLLQQIDAIKVQFVHVTNQMREKKNQGITRQPVTDYPDFMSRSASTLLPPLTNANVETNNPYQQESEIRHTSHPYKQDKSLSLSAPFSKLKAEQITERLRRGASN